MVNPKVFVAAILLLSIGAAAIVWVSLAGAGEVVVSVVYLVRMSQFAPQHIVQI
jgi:hypothetical protein